MISPILTKHLVCPRTKSPLRNEGGKLISSDGYEYSVVNGIPVMIFDDGDYTHPVFRASLENDGMSVRKDEKLVNGIDWFVQKTVAATSGNLYVHLIGNLQQYPIPDIRLPPAKNNQLMLDIGSNWGRWAISAAKLGYRVIATDPSLEALLAAKRVCQQMGVESVDFVVADARYLPFVEDTFDVIFSYSVLQHLSKEHVRQVLSEIKYTLKKGGESLIQMPNKYGIRNLYNQLRRINNPENVFRVRYWTNPELKRTFSSLIGPSRITVDGYFGLGIQPKDIDLMPTKYKLVIRTSEGLRRISLRIPLLIGLADSVYVHSTRS